jgi:hypothetical protein
MKTTKDFGGGGDFRRLQMYHGIIVDRVGGYFDIMEWNGFFFHLIPLFLSFFLFLPFFLSVSLLVSRHVYLCLYTFFNKICRNGS